MREYLQIIFGWPSSVSEVTIHTLATIKNLDFLCPLTINLTSLMKQDFFAQLVDDRRVKFLQIFVFRYLRHLGLLAL
jgi:hypothetical protein